MPAFATRAPELPPFEPPATLEAAEVLPPYLLESPVHTIAPEVRNDGTTNFYRIESSLGDVEAVGRDGVARSVQELRALELLQRTRKRTGAAVGFNQGVKKVVTAPYHSVKRVVFNPLYAVEAVPGEIVDYAGKIATVSDLFKYGPRVFIRRSLGIDGARKALARRLNVEVDADNDALREEIRRVGWGVWWGGLVPELGEDYIDLSLDLSTEVGNLGDGNLGRAVNALQREVFPRNARRMLKKMDVPKSVNKGFRKHPHFDGSMREDLAEALLTMEGTEDRTDFVRWAKTADDDLKAQHAVRLAQVLAVYHATERPMSRFEHHERGLLVHDTTGTAVAPITHDYLLWNATAEQALSDAEALNADDVPMEVWSLGDFSPTLHGVLESRGLEARTHIDEGLPPLEVKRKFLKGLEQSYEKRVEEPAKKCFLKRFRPDRRQRLVLEPLQAP